MAPPFLIGLAGLVACAPMDAPAQSAPARAAGAGSPAQTLPQAAPTSGAMFGPVPTVPPAPGARVLRADGVPAATVRVFDDDFEPKAVTVRAGEVVEWYHTGLRLHTVSAPNGSWNSGGLRGGEDFLLRFDTPGTYEYFCLDHVWMRGIVRVEA